MRKIGRTSIHEIMGWLRSFVHRARFRAGLWSRVALDVLATAVGLGLIAFGGHSPAELIGAALSCITAIVLTRDLYRRFRRQWDFRLSPNHEFAGLVTAAQLPQGYRLESFAGVAWATNDEVNALLDKAENALELDPGDYELPDPVRDHYSRFLDIGTVDYNDWKVRLRTDPTPELLIRQEPVHIQRTDYFSGAATNDKAGWQLEHCGDDRRIQQWSRYFAMSDQVVQDGRLISLADSGLSNHIGLTALLITADHRIVLQDQGEQAIDPRCVNLGSSGSLDLSDIQDLSLPREKRLRTFQDAVRRGMEREAAEETSASVGGKQSTIRLTGYARLLHRGGKPEFCGILRTASVFAALKAGRRERKFVHHIEPMPFEPSPAGLVEAIDTLLGRCALAPRRHSPSMIVCLHLARSNIERFGIDLSPVNA